jgi:hypothetical protein
MTTVTDWNELANSPRWGGVVAFIRNWIGPFNAKMGMNPEELEAILNGKGLHLPVAVREWQILAANWCPGRLNVWIHPSDLTLRDEAVALLTDTVGATSWEIRLADFHELDPPVYSVEMDCRVSPSFSKFVAAMTINDVLFGDDEEPEEVRLLAAQQVLTSFLSSPIGDYFTDNDLKTATVLAFAYPNGGFAHAKARTSAGRAVLKRLS